MCVVAFWIASHSVKDWCKLQMIRTSPGPRWLEPALDPGQMPEALFQKPATLTVDLHAIPQIVFGLPFRFQCTIYGYRLNDLKH